MYMLFEAMYSTMFDETLIFRILCRWNQDANWEICVPAAEFEWKQVAEPIMKLYTESTDGSFIEAKELCGIINMQTRILVLGNQKNC
mgnify:CR=1 FL=1